MRGVRLGMGLMAMTASTLLIGCSDDAKDADKTSMTTAGAPGSGGSGGTSATAAGSGGLGGSVSAAGSGQGGGTAGSAQGGRSAGCKVLSAGETGEHGLALAYAEEGFSTSYRGIGVDGDQVYFTADRTVLAYPAAGGTAKALGQIRAQRAAIQGGKLYWVDDTSAMAKLLSAPLADLTATTTLAEPIASPQYLTVDDQAVYFERREPPAILKVPLTGGEPEALVPDAEPLGMISHAGNVYWLDFATNRLERVPAGGGTRQKLVESFFGGQMTALANSVFWADSSRGSIEKWAEGATMSTILDGSAQALDNPDGIAVKGDTVYWSSGFNCGVVHRVQSDGSSKGVFTQGTDGADWLAIVGQSLFVLGRGGLYRADL